MIRCGRIVLRWLNIERLDILKEHIFVDLRIVTQRFARLPGSADRLVIDIREIHNLRHAKARVLQIASQQILKHVGAKVADMGRIVDRRATGIEADMPLLKRHDLIKLPRHGVIYLHPWKLLHESRK